MELQELVEQAQRLNSYVVAIVKSRHPEEFFVLSLTDTYEDAVMCRRVLNTDGIYDVIIVPPFERKEIPPNETADYFRSIYNMQVQEPAVKFRWNLKL